MRLRNLALAVAACALFASSARGESTGAVRLRYDSVSPGGTSTIYWNGANRGTVYTGQYNLLVDPAWTGTWGEGYDVLGLANGKNIVAAFCADVMQYAPTSFRIYNVFEPQDAPIGGLNGAIFPDGMGEQKAANLRRLFGNNIGSVAGNDSAAAAFQLAVWEIIYETSGQYDVSNSPDKGTFYTTSAAGFVALANDWLGSLGTQDDPSVHLRILTSEDSQDYAIMFLQNQATTDVPEPVTLLTVTAGALCIGGYVRRRRLRPA